MGAASMCPFPGNDHSIRPDDWANRQYLGYGALTEAMNGREWVLEKQPLPVVSEDVKTNIFKVGDHHAIPVVFAENEKATLRTGTAGTGGCKAEVLHPGKKESEPPATADEPAPLLEISTVKSCAPVKISPR